MDRKSQKSVEGKHHLEFLCSSAGTDTNVPGELRVQKGSIVMLLQPYKGFSLFMKCYWALYPPPIYFKTESVVQCCLNEIKTSLRTVHGHIRSLSIHMFQERHLTQLINCLFCHTFFIHFLVSLCLGSPSWVSGAPWRSGINGRESRASVWGAAGRVYEPASLWTLSTHWGAPAKH